MNARNLATAAFAIAVVIGCMSWSSPVKAQYEEHEREHIERQHRIDECVEEKKHHIHEMQERNEIRYEEAERMRDHAREDCEKEFRRPDER